jgi:hypothetical protein
MHEPWNTIVSLLEELSTGRHARDTLRSRAVTIHRNGRPRVLTGDTGGKLPAGHGKATGSSPDAVSSKRTAAGEYFGLIS